MSLFDDFDNGEYKLVTSNYNKKSSAVSSNGFNNSTSSSNTVDEVNNAKTNIQANNTEIEEKESETLTELGEFVQTLKNHLDKNNTYIPRVRLEIGSITIDTANKYNNLFLSMTHNKNGSGLAGQCTFTLAYIPDAEMHMLNENASLDVNYLDKILCNPYQDILFSYGYAFPEEQMSPKYTLMITKYSVEIQNSTLIYTIEASASLVALKEMLFDIYGDKNGEQFKNMRPTEVVYSLYEQYLQPLGYDFEWGPDTQDTDEIVKEFPRVSQINLFDYIDSLLKEAKYEKDTEDTPESETSSYHMITSNKSGEQKIRVYRLCPSGENKTMKNKDIQIVFNWMNGKNDIVLDFRTEFNGIIPMSQIYAKEGTNPKFNLNDGNKFVAYLGTRAPGVGNKAGNLSDEDDGPISGSTGNSSTSSGSSVGAIAAGTPIPIPSGLGTDFSYMGWSTITNTTSDQYKLRSQAGEKYNSDGFAIINGRYVVACTSTFGTIGDYIDFYQNDGTIFKCIMGDEKSQVYCDWDHNPANKWGHDDGKNIIEFIKDSNHRWPDNPGKPTWYPQWSGKTIVKAVNGGNYFNSPSGPVGSSTANSFSTQSNRSKTNETSTTQDSTETKTKASKETSNTSKSETNVYGADYISEKTIWTQYSTYSYKATLTTIGIPMEIPLMTRFMIIPLLYGKAHHTRGVYMVTSMTDSIDSSGFTTTFNLIKLYSDEISKYRTKKYKKSVAAYLKKTGNYVSNNTKNKVAALMGTQVGNINVGANGNGGGSGSSSGSTSTGGQVYSGDATGKARELLEVACSQIGYHEKNSDENLDDFNAPNDGNGNYTKYWRDLCPSIQGSYWCCCFVSWCARKANISETIVPTEFGCANMYNSLAKKLGVNPNPSDVKPGYFFFRGPGEHIGIVVKDNGDGTFDCVEGNTSDGTVKRSTKQYSSLYFAGWY